MPKYSWEEMDICKDCHYKNESPDLCNFHNPPEEKPSVFNYVTGCSRYLRESKWKRMADEHE